MSDPSVSVRPCLSVFVQVFPKQKPLANPTPPACNSITRMPKRDHKPKNLVARSITLTDSKGKPRIYIGVHDDPTYSSISLFGPRDRSIEISADHEGGLHISLRDGTGKIVAGFGITSDDHVSVSLCDHRSGSRMHLGSDGTDQPPHVTVYHHGHIHWTTRKRRKKPA